MEKPRRGPMFRDRERYQKFCKSWGRELDLILIAYILYIAIGFLYFLNWRNKG
jgi:hypothetical protein